MDEPPSSLLDFFNQEHILYYLLTVIFLLLAAVVSASEAAFFSLEPDQIDEIRRGKTEPERKVSYLLANPRLLLAVLIFWKYVFLVGAAILMAVISLIGGETTTLSQILLLTITFAFGGVILPKIYGSANSLSLATRLTGVWMRIIRVTKFSVGPLLRLSEKVEKKIEAVAEENSVRELTQALELAAADKDTTEDQKEILRGIVNFGTLTVAEVMRPSNEMHCIDVSLNFHDLLIYIKKSGFSRLPAYHDSFEKIEGVLYIKDLLPYLKEPKKFNWQKLLRPAYFVPQTKMIDELLKDFQERRVHIAIAVDEEARVCGVITLEDIIEEIIGDIHDEFDEVGALYKKIDDKTMVIDSKIPMTEFCRLIDAEPELFGNPADETESLGSFLAELKNELPKIGDQIVVGHFTFVIDSVDHKRIKKLTVHIHEQKES